MGVRRLHRKYKFALTKSSNTSMKRIILLFLFVLPFLKNTDAQTFHAGFYAGATMTDVPGTDNIDNDMDFRHLGFTVAGTVSAKISPKTQLQMEIRYFQRGAQQTPAYDTVPNYTNTPTIGLNNYFDMTLKYVDIVVGIKHQVHCNLRNQNTDRYGIEAGVSLGALIGYSYEAQSINYPLELNPVDISPYVGIYYNVTPHFYIEGRYSNSINSAIKQSGSNAQYFLYYGSWDDGHNVSFNITLGFNFGGASGTSVNNTPPPPPAHNQDDDN
jgi:Outer membrane protein beta-barrel domain